MGVIGVYVSEVVTIAMQPITRVAAGQLSVEGDAQLRCAVSDSLKQTLTLDDRRPNVGAAAMATAVTRVTSWSTMAVRLACRAALARVLYAKTPRPRSRMPNTKSAITGRTIANSTSDWPAPRRHGVP